MRIAKWKKPINTYYVIPTILHSGIDKIYGNNKKEVSGQEGMNWWSTEDF